MGDGRGSVTDMDADWGGRMKEQGMVVHCNTVKKEGIKSLRALSALTYK